MTSYIESAAGVAAGARTGLGNLVIAGLFAGAMFCAPLVAAIPSYATAPALILVGALMCGAVARVKWDDFTDAVPAFLTLIATPLTFSIATGLSLGLLVIYFSEAVYREASGDQPADLGAERFVLASVCLPGFRIDRPPLKEEGMSVKLATAILAIAMVALPNIAKAQGQNPDTATHMVTGCLEKGGTATTFVLLDDNGKLWEVRSKKVSLAPHVGQTVTVIGTIPKQPKNSTDTTPQNHLVVTGLQMVRDSCKQQ